MSVPHCQHLQSLQRFSGIFLLKGITGQSTTSVQQLMGRYGQFSAVVCVRVQLCVFYISLDPLRIIEQVQLPKKPPSASLVCFNQSQGLCRWARCPSLLSKCTEPRQQPDRAKPQIDTADYTSQWLLKPKHSSSLDSGLLLTLPRVFCYSSVATIIQHIKPIISIWRVYRKRGL